MAESTPEIDAILARLDRGHQMGCSDPTDPERHTTYGDAANAIRGLLAAPFRCETHLCGHCGGCKAAKVRDLLSDAQATEAVLRGEIRRSESALATFDDVVAQRDALTRWLVKRSKKKGLPTIPIGTRVNVRNMGVGTVVGKDGYNFDGVAVIFDVPPRGFEEGCCAGVDECEVLSIPPASSEATERPGSDA